MCGIAGMLHFEASRKADAALLVRMCGALRHRGPDDHGLYVRGPVGLGHRRLSIIDLSAAGHQPMSNDDGSVWIVFNGEIYNFLDLRRRLEQGGARFRSKTDTEVLLRLYEAHGVDCLQSLRGMFAFAIWDARRRSLFVARDRLGVKPLFYRLGADGLSFASELKALLVDPTVERAVDPVAVHHYLTFQYVPSPFCAVRGVHKLPPAHYLLCHDGRVDIQRYWKLDYLPKREAGTRAEVEGLEEELREKLADAVRCRLVSDVPLGAFLSGGIDSSAVVAYMSRQSARPVKTFSIGFAEHAYDELPAARAVARALGTEHVEFRVRPDVVDLLPRIVRAYDEPFGDASALPTFVLSRLAREHVTVVLTGDGGDECFAGYDRYVANDLARRLGGVGRLLGHPLARRVLRALPHGDGPRDPRWRLKRFVDRLAQSPEERNAGWLSHFDATAKAHLYADGFRSRTRLHDSRELLYVRQREAAAADFLDVTLYSDVMTYLPDCLLVKADIATMASSLEARSPFLDHPLMEFAARLPSDLKLRRGGTKWILKRALRGLVPREILQRPKRGFDIPLDVWLRGEVEDMARDLLLGTRSLARDYFRPDAIRRMLDEHRSRRWGWQNQIWTLLMLEMWHREIADEIPVRADAMALG